MVGQMKFLKPIVILFLLFSTVLSGGCGHTKEDQERIIRYLDNRFGKDTYTIKQDESYYRWFVTLNQYPDLTVYYTVSRDPLSMTSPSITTNFDEVFSEHAVEEYKKYKAKTLIAVEKEYLNVIGNLEKKAKKGDTIHKNKGKKP